MRTGGRALALVVFGLALAGPPGARAQSGPEAQRPTAPSEAPAAAAPSAPRSERDTPPGAPAARPARKDGQRLERRALRERVRAMSPDERRVALEQLTRVRAMSADERAALRDRLGLADPDPAGHQRWRTNLERWRTLAPADKQRLRARWRELQALPAEERERLLGDDATE